MGSFEAGHGDGEACRRVEIPEGSGREEGEARAEREGDRTGPPETLDSHAVLSAMHRPAGHDLAGAAVASGRGLRQTIGRSVTQRGRSHGLDGEIHSGSGLFQFIQAARGAAVAGLHVDLEQDRSSPVLIARSLATHFAGSQ